MVLGEATIGRVNAVNNDFLAFLVTKASLDSLFTGLIALLIPLEMVFKAFVVVNAFLESVEAFGLSLTLVSSALGKFRAFLKDDSRDHLNGRSGNMREVEGGSGSSDHGASERFHLY